MKTYKIEFVKIDKQFASVTVEAEDRKAALSIARSLQEEDFEETESVHATEWKVKKNWSIWDYFKN